MNLVIDYTNYTAQDWYTRLEEYEAKGKMATLAVSCPDCYCVIPCDNEPPLPGKVCDCGNTTTTYELFVVHGLTGLQLYRHGPEPLETWAEVS